MRNRGNADDDEVYSYIRDKGEIGYIDIENDPSVCDYDPSEEGPVVVSIPFPFTKGKPQSVLKGETASCSITVTNTTDEPVEIWGIWIYCSNPEDSFTLSAMEPPSVDSDDRYIRAFREDYCLEDRVLEPKETFTLWISCKPKDVGLHTSIVHFDAGEDRIERVVFLLADDSLSQSLASNRPYSQVPQRKPSFPVKDYIPSCRPMKTKTQQKFKCFLNEYAIPKIMRELVANRQIPKVLTEGLDTENYSSFFSALLILEELHLEKEMKMHNMESVSLRNKGARFLALEVPGLAEKRPSLVQGDFVFAKVVGGHDPPYQGYIYQVEADEVLLRFADEFHAQHHYGSQYDIHFTYNRVNMRRLYQAIEAAEYLGNDLLFPSISSRRLSNPMTQIKPFASNLNDEQANALRSILSCRGSPPYVIYGPPGTGKTKTLVEAVLQVYMTRKGSRVLICAASNSAADHVLERLTSNEVVRGTEIFRLNAMTRPYEDVPPEHRQYSYFEDSVFKCPPMKALVRYRIVISTYASTSLLKAEGVERSHFSHIFLDEAGQASEPDAMVPLANLCQARTVVVLAGDPKQLGPVVYSRDADKLGLGRSYLERLFEFDLYRNEEKGFVTKLVRNYRSHPAILDLPSKLFYEGELLPGKEEDSDMKHIINGTALLPNSNFPVLFIGIQGCDEREGNNPSWFNRIEASKVVDIVKRLTGSGIDEAEIGVITPYRQQVMKIRKVLEDWEMLGVKVGSVEQFQGQEREVVIVSTVRSTIKHNEFDRAHCLGFLSNPRRFNVAITRAKSLLVVIGNPHIVGKDKHWDKLLKYCIDNNSYQGCQLPEKEEHEDEDAFFYR